MALPTPVKTWIIDPCNRIAFVSLLDTMQKYLFEIKEFLKLNGYTVKGSASAGVGAMDATDRWTSAATVTPRATVAAASQAWIVLTDANGVDIELTYQGASDDIARIAFSPGGLFVAAGTPNQEPTATDGIVVSSAVSLINATASADRLWSGWVDSTSKVCRFAIARAGVWVGRVWGVEEFSHTMSALVTSKKVWGFALTVGTSYVTTGTAAGTCRFVIAGATAVNGSLYFSAECFPVSSTATSYATTFGAIKPELQGSLGYPIYPLGIIGRTVGARGKAGDLYDAWLARTSGATDGDTYGTLQFISVPGYVGASGGIWTWDGATAVVMT